MRSDPRPLRIVLVIGLLVALPATDRVRGMIQSRPAVGAVDPTLLQAISNRMIGPHRGGRVTAVTGVPSERGAFYMGSSGGGVWKTVDYGETWENLSDGYFASASIGAIAVSLSDPKVVYAGTGSACLRGNIQPGMGLYKSTDAGATWRVSGLEDGGQIARIQVDPKDPNLIYVAVQGHAFGPNATRGVFRSKDGGKTWEKVLFIDDKTGAAELVMDPHDAKVLYATMWTGELKPWGLPATSPEGGVFKSSDGGDHWTKLSGGLPQGTVGRIGVAVSPADSKRVWVLVGDVPEAGVYRSDDAGRAFTLVNSDRNLTGRSSYYAHIFADPKDVNVVYSANRDFYKSTDGGVTFMPIPTPHGDDHALWIDPNDTRTMILGNDGGATVSVTGGRSWSSQLNQPTGEIYRVTVDDQVPYRVYGSQQDQTTRCRCQAGRRISASGCNCSTGSPSAVRRRGRRRGSARLEHRLCQRAWWAAHPVRSHGPAHPHAQCHGRRAEAGIGSPARPRLFISPLDPDSLYNASNVVHRSTTADRRFTVINPDLTGRQPEPPELSATRGSGDEGSLAGTIAAFETSRKEKGVLWAGTDDGIVQLSRDNGGNWKNVTPKDMPRFGLVNTIEPSPHDAAPRVSGCRPRIEPTTTAHISSARTITARRGRSSPTAFRRTISSASFARILCGKGLLYAGGEFGIYVSFNDGREWQSLQLNLPVTPGHGSGGVAGRFGALDQRPVVLDSGRHHAAA